MFEQAIVHPIESGHLVGDAPALIIVGIVLAFVTPRSSG